MLLQQILRQDTRNIKRYNKKLNISLIAVCFLSFLISQILIYFKKIESIEKEIMKDKTNKEKYN